MKKRTKIAAVVVTICLVISLTFIPKVMAAISGATTLEAEKYSYSKGIKVLSAPSGKKVGYINNGDNIGFTSINFDNVIKIEVSAASDNDGGTIEIRRGSTDGTLLGSINVITTNGWNNFKTFSSNIIKQSGTGRLYLVFKGKNQFLFDIDNIKLIKSTDTTSLSSTNSQAQTTTESTTTSSGTSKLVKYKPVANQNSYPAGIDISTKYRVMVKDVNDNSAWDPTKDTTATYVFYPDYPDPSTLPSMHKNIKVHSAQVDTDKKVKVKVEIIDSTSINTLELLPKSYTEVASSKKNDNKTVEFTIDPASYTKSVLVQINAPTDTKTALQDGLMIFINPISKIPAGNILVLPSGVVNNSSQYVDQYNRILIDNSSKYDGIYIPNDTILDARIEIKKDNFTVAGRGMVCNSRWKWPKSVSNWENNYSVTPDHKVVKGAVESSASNCTFEGITNVHPYHFNFNGADKNYNLKAFAWRYSSDGIHGETIKGCFTRVNDDSTYNNQGIIENNNFWGMQNGAIFQLGWGQSAANAGGNSSIKNCNVLRGEWTSDGGSQNNGIFSGVMGGTKGDIKNVKVENLNVYGNVFRVMAYDLSGHNGNLDNFSFKNVMFEKQPYYSANNYLECGGKIQNWTFENFTIGGKKVTSLNNLAPVNKKNVLENTFKFK